MKTLLLVLLFTVNAMAQDTTTGTLTSSFYVATKYDTVFVGIDTTFLKIGVDGYNGIVNVLDIMRIDSVWGIESSGLVVINPVIRRTHYYTKYGTRLTCNSDVYFMTKAWLKAD